MNCPNCKASNPDGATFCSECGFRMDGETPRHRVRRILVTLLIVLTALGVAMSTVAVWAHSVVFDTDRFVETVGPLIDDPDVQDVLATRLTDTIMTGLAIETKVSDIIENIILTKVDPDTLLIDSGLVDSLAAVDLALAVEREFGCKIPPTEIDVHLESVHTLAAFIAENARA